MRMGFRSFRNPVTKSGRTTNTTGSRIRSSVRTLRENTASLIEAAKSRVRQTAPGRGYSDATDKRKNTASADYAGESARKRAYNAGSGKFGQRQAKYQGMRSASPPQGESVGYKAGYAAGREVAASRYKSGLKAYSPSGRTGLENRTVRNAGLVARQTARNVASAAGGAYRAGVSAVSGVVGKARANRTQAPVAVQQQAAAPNQKRAMIPVREREWRFNIGQNPQKARKAMSSKSGRYVAATAGRYTHQGLIKNFSTTPLRPVATGTRVPHGPVAQRKAKSRLLSYKKSQVQARAAANPTQRRQAYQQAQAGMASSAQTMNAGRSFSDSNAVYRGVKATGRGVAGAYRAVKSGSLKATFAIQDAMTPGGVARNAVRAGRGVSSFYRGSQKAVFAAQDATAGVARGFKYAVQGNYQTAKYATMNAANAAKYGRSLADRMAAPVNNAIEKGIDYGIVRPGRAAILGAGRGISRLAGAATNAIKNRQYANARQAWNAANPPKPGRAGVFFNTGGQQTPMGRNSVAAGVRYQAAMAKKQAKQAAAAAPAPAPVAPAPKQSRFAVGTQSGQAASPAVRPAARVRQAAALQMRQQGFTKNQIVQAVRAKKQGHVFNQKPHSAARWGNKAAPNWSAFQPNAGGQNQPPVAAPAAASVAAPAAQAVAAATVQKVRAKRQFKSQNIPRHIAAAPAKISQYKSAKAFQTMRNDPDYDQPIAPRGSVRPEPTVSTPVAAPAPDKLDSVLGQAFNLSSASIQEPQAKRGRGRPKLTAEEKAVAKARRNELQRQRRQNKGK